MKFHRPNLHLFRKLGETGLLVSSLGFGASALGGVFHDITEDECIRVVRGNLSLSPLAICWQYVKKCVYWPAALVAGVNIIDTAPWYGNGKSEEMLGKALSGIPRQVCSGPPCHRTS